MKINANIQIKKCIYKFNIFLPKKITTLINLIIIILEYSAKKIRTNPPLLYSTLNPETNSDSPSAKSKGVRLVSANKEVKNIKKIGIFKKINQIIS